LKKAMKCQPNIFTRYLIMMRMKEIEKLGSENQVAIHTTLNRILRRKDKIFKDTQQFWKYLLEDGVTVDRLFMKIPSIHYSISYCLGAFKELMYYYAKNPTVLRS